VLEDQVPEILRYRELISLVVILHFAEQVVLGKSIEVHPSLGSHIEILATRRYTLLRLKSPKGHKASYSKGLTRDIIGIVRRPTEGAYTSPNQSTSDHVYPSGVQRILSGVDHVTEIRVTLLPGYGFLDPGSRETH
jgi:hypothetical protein